MTVCFAIDSMTVLPKPRLSGGRTGGPRLAGLVRTVGMQPGTLGKAAGPFDRRTEGQEANEEQRTKQS
jgi:hypothetical protein